MRRRHPQHDHDAGGDPSTLAAKAEVREDVWSAMHKAKVARFPGANGRIPNFVGAEAAAERLRGTDVWERAATLKANPDSPQLPVRRLALEDHKRLYMAAPRLAADRPFFLLDPSSLRVPPREAASIKGASRHGRAVDIDELEPVDMVVTGCVAVATDGARLGKGGGFSDLEYALAWETGLITASTVVVTTVHEIQVVDRGRIPVSGHDFRLDLIVTPERIVDCRTRRRRAAPRVHWDELTEEKIESIPLLRRLRSATNTPRDPAPRRQ